MKGIWGSSFTAVVIIGLILGSATTVGAFGTGYGWGSEGVTAATVPPPGVHYRMYNLLVDSDKLVDQDGNEVNVGFDLNFFGNVHRFAWITQKKIFGADFGLATNIPIFATDLEISVPGVKDSDIGVGDILIEPLVFAWHGDRYDAVAAWGFNMPTGHYDQNSPGCVGSGYWSSLLTLGATYYFDDAKSWSASALTRTIYYGEQKDTEITLGPEFGAEWGIGKQLPLTEGLLFRPGVVGYGIWQFGEDSGPGTTENKDTIYAIGAEVNLFWLPPHLYQINLRYLQEFGAKNVNEGSRFVLTLTKSF